MDVCVFFYLNWFDALTFDRDAVGYIMFQCIDESAIKMWEGRDVRSSFRSTVQFKTNEFDWNYLVNHIIWNETHLENIFTALQPKY